MSLYGQRLLVIERLERECRYLEAGKLRACGDRLFFHCTCCHKDKEVEKRCKRKWCPECARDAAARTVDAYEPLIVRMKWPLFPTFTVHHTKDTPIHESYNKVRAGLTKMKSLQWFRRRVAGGVAGIEVSTRDPFDDNGAELEFNGYHPHVHCLLDCRWLSVTVEPPRRGASKQEIAVAAKLSQREVVAQWKLCTGDPGAGMYVRRAKPGTVTEVLKYAVSTEALLDERVPLGPLIDVLAGRKAVVPWGTIRKGLKFLRAIEKEEKLPMICECGAESWTMLNNSMQPVPRFK